LTIKLQLLGGFQLCSEDGAPIMVRVRKAKALLAYLALHQGQPLSRDKLAGLLWEDSDDTRARHSLRQALADLRRTLPEGDNPILIAEDDQILLSAESIEVDVLMFKASLADKSSASLEQALALYQGEFLEGFNPRSAGFEEWMLAHQSHLREQALNMMSQLLDLQIKNNDHEPAVRTAIRLLALDPLQESTHRILIQLYAQLGRYGSALKQYRSCHGILLRELGVPPEKETQALYRKVMQDRNNQAPHNEEVLAEIEIAEPAEAGQSTTPTEMELRQTIMLWVRLDALIGPSEYAHEMAHQQLQEQSEKVQQQLASFGGEMVNQMGGNLLVAFGLSKAHDSEPERALQAAIKIQQLIGQDSSQPAIGIASGPVTRSNIGSAQTILSGAAVNHAGRLAALAAPGEILVTEEIYNSTHNLISAEALPALSAWRLLQLNLDEIQTQTRFVGRQNELSILINALGFCEKVECGQTFLLRGEGGIGKTRLLQEFSYQAEQQGFKCYRSMALEFGVETGSSPIRLLIDNLLGITDKNREAKVQQALTDGLIKPEQQIHLNDLLGIPQPEALKSLYDAMDNYTRRQGAKEVIAQLIELASEQHPLLLLVEDIHWADARTLELLAHIAVTVSSCSAILVMSTRISGEPLNPSWRGSMQGAPLTTLDLGPLRSKEALALAQQFQADEKMVQRYIDRAEGNPFFLEQLLINMESNPVQIPDSIRHMVWARLDNLEPEARKAIQAASVLGQRFVIDALRYLLNDEAFDPAPLTSQQLMRLDQDYCQFNHALLFEGIYDSLLDSRRRTLHLSAAEWYAERDLLLHAQHLDRAKAAEAVSAYLSAACQQGREFHYEQALASTARGLELVSDDTERFELLCYSGRLLQESGSITMSINTYRQASQFAPDEALPWIGIAAGLAIQDNHDEALAALNRAEQQVGQEASSEMLAQIHYYRGNSLFPLGRVDECLQEHKLAFKFAQQAESPFHQVRALSGLGDAYYQRGQMITAHSYFDQCVVLSREQGFDRIEVPNLAMRGVTAFFQNRQEEALADARTAIEHACYVGDKRAEALAHNILGSVLTYQNRLNEAECSFESAYKIALELGSKQFEVENLGMLTILNALQGKTSKAEALSKQTYMLIQQTDITYAGPMILGILATVHKNPGKKHKMLEEGEKILAQECVSHNYLHFYQMAIDVALELEEWGEVLRYTDNLEVYTEKEPLPWSDYYIDRGRCIACIRNGGLNSDLELELKRLREKGEKAGLQLSLAALTLA